MIITQIKNVESKFDYHIEHPKINPPMGANFKFSANFRLCLVLVLTLDRKKSHEEKIKWRNSLTGVLRKLQ